MLPYQQDERTCSHVSLPERLVSDNAGAREVSEREISILVQLMDASMEPEASQPAFAPPFVVANQD